MKNEKKELNIKGYKVVIENGDDLDQHKYFLLSSIESYALMMNRGLKIVFFNYDDDGKEAGVSFFWRRE